jgi:hypothetical protein
MIPLGGNSGCCISVREVYRPATHLRRIRDDLFFEALRLAEQFFIVGRSAALCADMAGVAHELLVKHKVRFQ